MSRDLEEAGGSERTSHRLSGRTLQVEHRQEGLGRVIERQEGQEDWRLCGARIVDEITCIFLKSRMTIVITNLHVLLIKS